MKKFKIAVAGTGYVGLSLSVLLAQHNQVMAVDIVQAKVDMINNHKSPIQDDYEENTTIMPPEKQIVQDDKTHGRKNWKVPFRMMATRSCERNCLPICVTRQS